MLAIRFIWLVTTALVLVTVYLFVTSLIVRTWQERRARFAAARRDALTPSILAYTLGDSDDLDAVAAQLKVPEDVIPYTDLITDLLNQVQGEETERLRHLMAVPAIRAHFHQKLFKGDESDEAEACMYYAWVDNLTTDETDRLRSILDHGNRLLAHAAATSLVAHPSAAVRVEAVAAMARRERVSRLALLELLYRFHSSRNDQMEEEGALLMALIAQPDLPESHVAILIQAMADIGYVGEAVALYELFEAGYRTDSDRILEAYCYALGRFGFDPAGERIAGYASHPSPRVRQAVAKALEALGDAAAIDTLEVLAADTELMVRMAAVFALARLGEAGKAGLDRVSASTADLQDLVHHVMAELDA